VAETPTNQPGSVDFIRLLFIDAVEERIAHRWASRLAAVIGAQALRLRPDTTLAQVLDWAAAEHEFPRCLRAEAENGICQLPRLRGLRYVLRNGRALRKPIRQWIRHTCASFDSTQPARFPKDGAGQRSPSQWE
jgi:hypothetical protein